MSQPLTTFWRTLVHFDRKQVDLWMGFRNALGIALPLAIGVGLGYPSSGLVAATGALNVAAADGEDSYRKRGARMLTSSVIGGAGVFIGALTAHNDLASTVVGVSWAFAAGLMVCLGTAAADIGMISLVVFVIYSAQNMTQGHAAWSGLIALAAGLFQTALSIALWPFRGALPERGVIGDFYNELARAATLAPNPYGAPLASLQSTQAQEALSPLAGDHRVEVERLFALVSQGERIRLTLFALGRSQVRVGREVGGEPAATAIRKFLELTCNLLAAIGGALKGELLDESVPVRLEELERPCSLVRDSGAPHLSDACAQMDALAGQLRAAVELAGSSTPAGEDAFSARQARTPWNLQLTGWLATLRANLSLDSSACRHAVRLAICIAIGDLIVHYYALPRSYWLNMTVALVLKPDFGSTFSRGVLRLAGTYFGLLLATVLFHLISPTSVALVVGAGILAFLMRSFGRANYGLLVTVLSALVVFLFSLIGIAPKDVIASRALNSSIGGTLALVIYFIWPTRERTQAPQAMASMLDAYRLYFQGVAHAYRDGLLEPHQLDRLRIEGRRARSNAETSVDRLGAEPFAQPVQVRVANAALASCHRFIHAAMALEAGLTPAAHPAESFQTFSHDLELTLYLLAAHLRGSPLEPNALPNLREDHNRLDRSDPLLLIEADRMTNSLNTLAEQVFRWTAPASLHSEPRS